MVHCKNILLSLFVCLFFRLCICIDTINPTRPLKDGDHLVSDGENFALGFFSPKNSSNRYVGIWYNKVSEQTVVWVANRDNPITNSSDVVLAINETGNLVLHERGRGFVFWSTNVSAVVKGSVRLLDSGNLMLFRDESRKDVVWQSFDYPTNTFLPGMKFGLDRITGLNRVFTSWKSSSNPGTGEYLQKIEFVGTPQAFLYKGTTRIWRMGTWTSNGWSGLPDQKAQDFIFNITYIDNKDEVVVVYNILNSSIFSRLVVSETGTVEWPTWHEADRRWISLWSFPNVRCDTYNYCGSFGFCNPDTPDKFECECFLGYEPQEPLDWYLRDGSRGCKGISNVRFGGFRQS